MRFTPHGRPAALRSGEPVAPAAPAMSGPSQGAGTARKRKTPRPIPTHRHSTRSHAPFGNPAVLVGPVALRPPLAEGLPLSWPVPSGATSLHLNILAYGGHVNLPQEKVGWQAPDRTEETATFGWAVLVDCIWLSTLAGGATIKSAFLKLSTGVGVHEPQWTEPNPQNPACCPWGFKPRRLASHRRQSSPIEWTQLTCLCVFATKRSGRGEPGRKLRELLVEPTGVEPVASSMPC